MLQLVPCEGQEVRIIKSGEDYGRVGTVRFTLNSRIWVDLGEWDDRFAVEELEAA